LVEVEAQPADFNLYIEHATAQAETISREQGFQIIMVPLILPRATRHRRFDNADSFFVALSRRPDILVFAIEQRPVANLI